jgi:hypothetical protein
MAHVTLCEFLANAGGLRLFRNQADTVGASDLLAMGADKWHRAVTFRKKLTRLDSGLCPDDAALAATEAGYFPHLGRRADVDELLEAIRDELAGKPVYTLDDTRAMYEAEMAAYDRENTMASFHAMAEIEGRVIPEGAEILTGADGSIVCLYETVYVTKKGREGKSFYAKAFRANERKPEWHHVFYSHDDRMARVNSFLALEVA